MTFFLVLGKRQYKAAILAHWPVKETGRSEIEPDTGPPAAGDEL